VSHKYLAFDIETAKVLPDDFGDLHDHRPLGITCMATWCSDESSAMIFYSKKEDGSPATQMISADLIAFIEYLKLKSLSGYTIITHNGLGFDFDILGEESGRVDDCRALAVSHVDMMFHFFCGKGFPIGLNAAAQALGISKPVNVDGSNAAKLWIEGDYQTVLNYVAQDCKLTLAIAETSERSGKISWLTGRGSISYFELPNGWLTVKEALTLPLPDNSWMENPWPRAKFTNWLGNIQSV